MKDSNLLNPLYLVSPACDSTSPTLPIALWSLVHRLLILLLPLLVVHTWYQVSVYTTLHSLLLCDDLWNISVPLCNSYWYIIMHSTINFDYFEVLIEVLLLILLWIYTDVYLSLIHI